MIIFENLYYMMNINFYGMGSFIILSTYVIWEAYPNVTFCTLTHQSSGNWGRHAKQHAFLYQLWITGVLLNILFGPPNHDSQNSPDHELGSWAKNEMLRHELELWALMRLYRHEFGSWASASFLWIWTLLGFKIDSPKIHDNVDVVQVANEMKRCGVKNLSSTFSPPMQPSIVELSAFFFSLLLPLDKPFPFRHKSFSFFFFFFFLFYILFFIFYIFYIWGL